VIEPVPDMPPGTLGFKASGEITAENLEEVALAPIRATVEAGEKLRVLTIVDHLHEDPRAIWENIKADAEFGLLNRDSWQRTAVVSDVGWAQRLTKLFGWAVPGELRVFEESELEAAKAWLAAEG
jgi:hypothetical protein